MEYGNFEAYIDETAVGSVEVLREGLFTRIKCKARYESGEVLRLAADLGDRYEVIGVMMPKNKGFALEKCFTKNEIKGKNLDRTVRFVLVSEGTQYKAEPEEAGEERCERVWVRCTNPAALFDDWESGEAISRCEGVLKAEEDGFTYIAVPAVKSLPALPIFYFGQREMLNGCEHLVFTLKDGKLVI